MRQIFVILTSIQAKKNKAQVSYLFDYNAIKKLKYKQWQLRIFLLFKT